MGRVSSGSAHRATVVPDPWRAVNRPSSASSAYAWANGVAGDTQVEREGPIRRQPGAGRPDRISSRSAPISRARTMAGAGPSWCCAERGRVAAGRRDRLIVNTTAAAKAATSSSHAVRVSLIAARPAGRDTPRLLTAAPPAGRDTPRFPPRFWLSREPGGP
ncbi:hypothetical protein AB0J35_53950 [Nonomuraea angiospora]|uniref:hypothetical protein n=1 Tax=Nonomuraea angiospora TaxID=46172 RepID=UPI00342F2EA9